MDWPSQTPARMPNIEQQNCACDRGKFQTSEVHLMSTEIFLQPLRRLCEPEAGSQVDKKCCKQECSYEDLHFHFLRHDLVFETAVEEQCCQRDENKKGKDLKSQSA